MPGTPIRLGAGENIERVMLRIPRGGVISGVITDEFGDPALGIPVRAMRFTFTNGERTAYPAGNVVTDDLGGYRIAGLMPGDYVVSAVPRDNVAAASAQADVVRDRMAQVAAAGGHGTRRPPRTRAGRRTPPVTCRCISAGPRRRPRPPRSGSA